MFFDMKNSLERKFHFRSKYKQKKKKKTNFRYFSFQRTEHSSDQVIKPINLEALTKWIGHIPNDVKKELDTLAPMLRRLGYDTVSEVPSYGVADTLVLENMNKLKENAGYWQEKMKVYARQPPNGTLMDRARLNG